ncbi:hypothetical protein RRF57_000342 [Xylaria bambusicola]|uniref:Uncharacterized protein n=1 Tax=Xylaria bambusicola TaxID=326684 RepID=A0AAN7UBZ2_9PEZI
MPYTASLTLTIHQCNIARAGLMVEKSADLRSTRIFVPSLYEELFCNLLIGNDDELLAQHTRAVNGPVYVGPFFELLPHAKPIEVMDSTDDRELLRTREYLARPPPVLPP